jgi:hypothetical protein
VRFQKRLRKTLGPFSEEKVASVFIGSFRVGTGSLCGKAPHLLYFISMKEIVQVFIVDDFHQIPVVQTGTLHSLLGNVEAQRANQMQSAAGGGTGAGDITAVLWNLRFHQYNIEHFLHLGDSVAAVLGAPGRLAQQLYPQRFIKSMQKMQKYRLFIVFT